MPKVDISRVHIINIDTLQLIDTLNVGIIALNRKMEIVLWNRWMEEHSKIDKDQALGRVITLFFPDIEEKRFSWKVQAVFKLDHHSVFPQEHYQCLFHFPHQRQIQAEVRQMQQNCILSPLKNEEGMVEYVLVTVYDVTDAVIYQQQLITAKKLYERLSAMDELTAVYNRRHLWQRLQEEFARYLRNGQPLSFLLLDIDHFKRINYQYGHMAGDYVLKELCATLPSILRKYDIVGRYEGEEFGVILTNTNISSSLMVAERMRSHVEAHDFVFQQQRIPVTISIGLAEAHCGTTDIEGLIHQAEEALCEAKDKGRNRVCFREHTACDEQHEELQV
ncbi:MAG: diguanylate cyclase [bacterium]